LPFRLKVGDKTELDGSTVIRTSYKVHGYLHVDGEFLVVDLGGAIHVQTIGSFGVRDEKEKLPDRPLMIPARDLYRVELTGGWFRPRLTVQARRAGALAEIPSEVFGVVNFWYERSERFTAIAVANELAAAIESAAAPTEGLPGQEMENTPPGGSGSIG
jgi:hypothetical protein